MSQSPPTTPPRPPITDSPWFWLLLFSAAGIVCLMLIEGQYRPRQRRLEMQYRAREEMLRRQAEGEPAAREVGQEGDATPPTTAELIIPLWPLMAACVLVLLLSTSMLWRARRSAQTVPQQPSGGVP
jgi:type VI protein secretion system component VasF